MTSRRFTLCTCVAPVLDERAPPDLQRDGHIHHVSNNLRHAKDTAATDEFIKSRPVQRRDGFYRARNRMNVASL